jgi:excinuclease ABC subunit A
MLDRIVVRGARQHNLRNVDLEIPRHKLTVITGLSGSGKSSLAFDTIYAEGQRRYIESLSAFARQFFEQMEKPDVDSVEGLSPALSIEQKTTSRSPRSTVGTVTEIYDYMRLLFASIGKPHCHLCGKPIAHQNLDQIVDTILAYPPDTRVMILAPVVRDRKGEFKKLFEKYLRKGYVRARVDGRLCDLDEPITLARNRNHTIEVVVDRLLIKPGIRRRLELSTRAALDLADGLVTVAALDIEERLFSERQACADCGINIPDLEPRSFSFNSKYGACPECDGTGERLVIAPDKVITDASCPIAELRFPVENPRIASYLHEALLGVARRFHLDGAATFAQLPPAARQAYFYGDPAPAGRRPGKTVSVPGFRGIGRWLEEELAGAGSARLQEEIGTLFTATRCPACGGSRLRPESRAVKVDGRSIAELSGCSIGEALAAFRGMKLSAREEKIARPILKEIIDRLEFLLNVGVGYLSLDRSAASLSGGESQRIRLASQIGSGLTGVLYVLDEPSIGLHQRDNDRLLATLERLRDLGNTVIVVEHDEDAIRRADHVVDMGPGAGVHGGMIVAQGTPEEVMREPASLTGNISPAGARCPCPPATARAGARSLARAGRLPSQQFQGRHRALPVGSVRLRDRRLGLGQILARRRHPLSGAGPPARGRAHRAGRASRAPGHRARRQGRRHRSVADRPHPALQPGHLHGRLHPDPRLVHRPAGGPGARLQGRPLQLQRQGRALRGLPGRRRHQDRDALLARRFRHLRRLQGQALQP